MEVRPCGLAKGFGWVSLARQTRQHESGGLALQNRGFVGGSGASGLLHVFGVQVVVRVQQASVWAWLVGASRGAVPGRERVPGHFCPAALGNWRIVSFLSSVAFV